MGLKIDKNMDTNIFEQDFSVNRNDRSVLKKHRSILIWFTGLSGSGKSTLANAVEQDLFKKDIHTYLLDGDNVRRGINSNLSFSPEDRSENIRRIGEVANLMMDAGLVVLASFVSPYREDRENVKKNVGYANFIEVFVNTSVEECERRDVKGLYKKARKGEIKNFTGINAPYEEPIKADIEIKTEITDIDQAVKNIMIIIENRIKL